jgi:hypothetical protein
LPKIWVVDFRKKGRGRLLQEEDTHQRLMLGGFLTALNHSFTVPLSRTPLQEALLQKLAYV